MSKNSPVTVAAPAAPAFAPHEAEHLKAMGVSPEQQQALQAHGLNFGNIAGLFSSLLQWLLSSGILTPKPTTPPTTPGGPQTAPPAP